MMLQIGERIEQANDNIYVRKVCAEQESGGGKGRPTFETRFSQSSANQRMRDVIH
jgi:hypothetical protein